MDEQNDHLKTIDEALHEAFEKIDARAEERDVLYGITTGFSDLDHVLQGLQPGHLIALAGRPSMGKSALALTVLRNAAISGHKVALFSPSASREQVTMQLLSGKAAIDSFRLKVGYLAEKEWSKLTHAIGELGQTSIKIDDTPRMSVSHIRQAAHALAEEGLDLIVIDYLQLICGSAKWDIETAVIDLKNLARELDVALLVVSSLPSQVEKRVYKSPLLSDLGDFDSLAQHADQVVFLYRDEHYNPDTERKSTVDVFIAKNRTGPIAKVELYFEKTMHTMQAIAPGFPTS